MPHIAIGEEQLHYRQLGTGAKLLLAFHGYGENSDRFQLFEQYLGKAYTILSFDLPHHGASKWTTGRHFDNDCLLTFIANVRLQFNCKDFSLMGYSMGGRVCLSILAVTPQYIDRVLLMATDGLSVNYNYFFITRTVIGQWLLRTMLRHHNTCFRLAGWLRQLKLISATKERLVVGAMATEAKRHLLARAWPCLGKLIVRPAKLKKLIADYNIHVDIYMGRYDKVLPPRLARRFAEGCRSVNVYIPERGHRIFDEDNVQEIAQSLL
jgi:pimeloyl-ACP methyl ester carboxylesterase